MGLRAAFWGKAPVGAVLDLGGAAAGVRLALAGRGLAAVGGRVWDWEGVGAGVGAVRGMKGMEGAGAAAAERGVMEARSQVEAWIVGL